MSRNKAIESARAKGALARREGKPDTANPYGDDRTHTGSVTFARAFLRAWLDGWRTADEEIATARLADAVRTVERDHPLRRCWHGNALEDGGGERLEPPCGCRLVKGKA